MKLKETLKKFWFLLWKDDSLKGWIFSIIFIFIIVKFVFFPLMNLATGTSLPLAIVESCSMHHSGFVFSNFDSWYDRHEERYSNLDLDKETFFDFPLKKGFTKGDILLVTRANPENLEVGDVIIFDAGQRNPIIHRIVNISKNSDGSLAFSTKGDNNNGQLSFEKNISESQLIGRAKLKVAPYFGWVKLVFFEWQKPQGEKGFCIEN